MERFHSEQYDEWIGFRSSITFGRLDYVWLFREKIFRGVIEEEHE